MPDSSTSVTKRLGAHTYALSRLATSSASASLLPDHTRRRAVAHLSHRRVDRLCAHGAGQPPPAPRRRLRTLLLPLLPMPLNFLHVNFLQLEQRLPGSFLSSIPQMRQPSFSLLLPRRSG